MLYIVLYLQALETEEAKETPVVYEPRLGKCSMIAIIYLATLTPYKERDLILWSPKTSLTPTLYMEVPVP